MDIHIEIIPYNKHRSIYINPVTGRSTTVGDWWVDSNGIVQVRASEMETPCGSALVIIHELVEVLIESVKRTGALRVPARLVEETDEFDKTYEANRTRDNKEGEPGCEPNCPVHQGHMAASAIEMIAAMILRVNYNAYADEIASL